jgi:hypothetical protein
MAEHSLSPSSLIAEYTTAFGHHKMTIPTLVWLPTNIGAGVLGSYLAWDGVTNVSADDMVDNLLNLLAAFVPATTTFDLVTIYNQATSTSDNIPARSKTLAIVGTSGASGFSEAQSTTFNFKTTANGDAKLVLLDTPVGSSGFVALHPAGFTTPVTDLAAEFEGTLRAWSGRDDARPNVLRKVTYDLNEKLQKAYKMSE